MSTTTGATYVEQHATLESLFTTLLKNALPVTDLSDRIGENTRYTRELLGLLQTRDLAVEDEADGYTIWTAASFDDDEQARSLFEVAFPAPHTPQNATAPAPPRPKSAKNATPHPCLCGCGELTKGNYRPGHDARHAGMVAKQISILPLDEGIPLLADLPSPALQQKAAKMAERLRTKTNKPARVAEVEAAQEVAESPQELAEEVTGMQLADAEAVAGETAAAFTAVDVPEDSTIPAQAPQAPEVGIIKVGRWTYPGRRFPDGRIERNEARSGTGSWVPAVGPEIDGFRPGK